MEDEDETGEGDSEDERNESGLGNDDQCRLNRLFQKIGVFQKKCTSVVRSQSHLGIRTRVSKQGRLGIWMVHRYRGRSCDLQLGWAYSAYMQRNMQPAPYLVSKLVS